MRPEQLLMPCIPVKCRSTQSRAYRDGRGNFLKYCRGVPKHRMQPEWDFLCALTDSRYFPNPYRFGDEYIIMEDLGDSEILDDLEFAQRHVEPLLTDLRRARILHNDLIPANTVIRGNVPHAFDFGWSKFVQGELDQTEDRQRLLRGLALRYRLGAAALHAAGVSQILQ